MKFIPKKISTLYIHTAKYLSDCNLQIMPVFWTSFMPENLSAVIKLKSIVLVILRRICVLGSIGFQQKFCCQNAFQW